MGSGVLTGKYNKDSAATGRAQGPGVISERSLTIAAEVIAVADELEVTASQVAIAWVRRGEGNIIPLVGARTEAQLVENLGSLEVTLNEGQLKRLNDVSAIQPGFPHEMLRPQSQGTAKRVHNHRTASTPEW